MKTLELFKNRYTTKEYDKSKKLDTTKIEELKMIINLSPSSINSQPWQFVFVQSEKLKEELAKASRFNDQKVLNCNCVVVLRRYATVEGWEKWMQENLAQPAQDYYNNFVKQQSEEEIIGWFKNQVYLSLGVLLSACASLGIDSTPMEGIEMQGYDQILDSEGLLGYQTVVAVAIGVRSDDDFNQLSKIAKRRRNIDDVIVTIG